MESTKESKNILILGIGNLLMGDEGVGVHVIRYLEDISLEKDVELIDGGTAGFNLLGPMQKAEKIIIIDATIDSSKPGTIKRLKPKYAHDYPTGLSAHDIGLKDLIDSFYLLDNDNPNITLFTISIAPLKEFSVDLSIEIQSVIPEIVDRVLKEIDTKI
ncbi:MAG: hydrogenase maturation protease [Spirochaetota bacterium]|nr:hydrogenase maturation protease [Spirochaetota bacterium]